MGYLWVPRLRRRNRKGLRQSLVTAAAGTVGDDEDSKDKRGWM